MERFVNPYNFIKFPEEKAQAYTEEDWHTGVIEYSITTKTPLFIPNSSSEKAFKATDMHRNRNINLMISFPIRN